MNTIGRLPEKHVTHCATNECLKKSNMIGETVSRVTTGNKTTRFDVPVDTEPVILETLFLASLSGIEDVE